MKISTLIFLFICLSSCKKEFTCNCTTLDPNAGFVANPATFHVKERNSQDALENCAKQYNDSGKATHGINCAVN